MILISLAREIFPPAATAVFRPAASLTMIVPLFTIVPSLSMVPEIDMMAPSATVKVLPFSTHREAPEPMTVLPLKVTPSRYNFLLLTGLYPSLGLRAPTLVTLNVAPFTSAISAATDLATTNSLASNLDSVASTDLCE